MARSMSHGSRSTQGVRIGVFLEIMISVFEHSLHFINLQCFNFQLEFSVEKLILLFSQLLVFLFHKLIHID